MKQKTNFLWKKNQNGRLKKSSFSNSANSQYVFIKNSWIGPWVIRIDWCEGHWCGLTYMVMTASQLISWVPPMPFPSIYSTNPRTEPWNFHENILRIGKAGKWDFFWDGHFFSIFFSFCFISMKTSSPFMGGFICTFSLLSSLSFTFQTSKFNYISSSQW